VQAKGQVLVEEDGANTVVTITVSDLFASGSSRVSARHEPLVHRIGKALNDVPGRIVVIGHTDDVPLRSFRFQDNYELSRARANEVTTLLKADVADAARMSVVGRGDSAPRYLPANLPDNRARNRRVEIKHVRDR
jgi:type VI secretion system protein ImpK